MTLPVLVNEASAVCAFVAAGLWLYSARVEVWADDQTGPRSDNMVILKEGRMYDVTGSAQAQSRWSAYAAIAAAIAALFQGLGLLIG
ncbi:MULTISPECIES: hypothetical protein [Bradyrhizobium]|uniref:hypothetical protein n=1 Tax=Bradyrhizobium TaxID=374 RepID=UPI000675E129|nr:MULTISPECIES: hypothetical protein [Bradyrhizobium]MBR1362898.1 hypothetical protein [Bradyrhizobium ottawaense]WQN79972.1 hypothetical protein U7859_23480 [Bradyrhizobium ottawaense]GMO41013.1 hypothetical protein BwSF12_43820 [Bradyrhizobium ottawaense]GMO54108.1 hypothetical protein BwSG20_00390 [Bradyrhizobium ottawaense]